MKKNMRKSLILTVISLLTAVTVQAQKFALVDMEYILGSIPAYEQANLQIENASKQWQAEVDKLAQEAKKLYTDYQAKVENMSKAERNKSEEAVIAKEKAANDLRRKYFGPEGELYKKREQLLQPIEDEVYEAVKVIATRRGYAAVIDRASASSILFASPDIDISDEVLQQMGYTN